jgi:hypothetical protein
MFDDGSLIFMAFVGLYLLALTFGLYSRTGSAINQRPYDHRYSNAPGARRAGVLDHDADASAALKAPRRRRRRR